VLLEELLPEGSWRPVDRSVHAVEELHEPRQMGRQVQLDDSDVIPATLPRRNGP